MTTMIGTIAGIIAAIVIILADVGLIVWLSQEDDDDDDVYY